MASRPEQPWEKLGWEDDFMQVIWQCYGTYFAKKDQLDKAAIYFQKSLNISENLNSLKNRSVCLSELAKADEAYDSSLKALAINSENVVANLQYCNTIYDLGDLERSYIQTNDYINKYKGNKRTPFIQRAEIIRETFNNSLGPGMTPFLQRYRKYLDIVWQDLKKQVDGRLLWRIRKETGRCDVVSFAEAESEKLHPRELKRRQLCFKVYNQIYMQPSWTDLMLISHLRKSKLVLLPQTPRSTKILNENMKDKYAILQRFIKMMQVRSPMYNEKCRIYGKREKVVREIILNRAQYQTRRIGINLLRLARKLRAEGKIRQMAEEIENVMGYSIILKSNRMLPWKFEYMNEIYNLLALAYLDRIYIPDDIDAYPLPDQLIKLVDGFEKEKVTPPEYVFGDQSKYQEPDVPDYEFIAYKKRSTHLEQRVGFAKFPIEICYIYHELSRNHLEQGKYDDCVTVAERIIRVSKTINNTAYLLLGNLLICKSHSVQRKNEKALIVINSVIKIVKGIGQKDDKQRLLDVFNKCIEIIKTLVEEEKQKDTAKLRRTSKTLA